LWSVISSIIIRQNILRGKIVLFLSKVDPRDTATTATDSLEASTHLDTKPYFKRAYLASDQTAP